MQRTICGKRFARRVATVTAVAALGTGAGAPAFAGVSTIGPTSFTINITATTLAPDEKPGAIFSESGIATDSNGATIGSVTDSCVVNSVSMTKNLAQCTMYVVMSNDSEVALGALAPVSLSPSDYPQSFNGVILGGTNDYEGVTGQATLTSTSPGIYQVLLMEK
jgi:hypothetical protein